MRVTAGGARSSRAARRLSASAASAATSGSRADAPASAASPSARWRASSSRPGAQPEGVDQRLMQLRRRAPERAPLRSVEGGVAPDGGGRALDRPLPGDLGLGHERLQQGQRGVALPVDPVQRASEAGDRRAGAGQRGEQLDLDVRTGDRAPVGLDQQRVAEGDHRVGEVGGRDPLAAAERARERLERRSLAQLEPAAVALQRPRAQRGEQRSPGQRGRHVEVALRAAVGVGDVEEAQPARASARPDAADRTALAREPAGRFVDPLGIHARSHPSDERPYVSTIAFFPEGAYGPTNNCVGIGDVLRRRGHRVVFIVEESFAGTLEAQGFEERLMRLGPPPAADEEPGQFWKDFIRDTAPVFRTPTIEQLETFIAPTFQALLDGARYVDDRLREIIEEVRPDVIVEDNVVAFPALPASGVPWVRIASCNPAEIKDEEVPPPFSGYPAANRSRWEDYWAEYRRTHAEMHAAFDAFCVERGAPPLPDGEMIHASDWLNLYLYPREIDYRRSEPLGPTWHNLESSVRTTDAQWTPPPEIAEGDGALIYVSLGSLGSGDVPLMKRLVEALADTPHRYVVSKGPQHGEYELAGNMIGEEFLPQVSVMPQVDLVITHGGNNTTTESLHFGKPMLLLPIFWDQHDNAQRIDETGFGTRLPTYSFSDGDLHSAIDGLLANGELHGRLTGVAQRLQSSPGNERAALLIERLAATAEPAVSG